MRYLDTSAFLKLIVAEDHSLELREAMTGAELWSSLLLEVDIADRSSAVVSGRCAVGWIRLTRRPGCPGGIASLRCMRIR